MLNLSNEFWKGRRVLLTGHTGFKGTWASIILNNMGAKVYGVSLPDKSKNKLFNETNMSQKIECDQGIDIRNLNALRDFFQFVNPEIIMHFAAQPLVRESYINPVETFQTNVLGTVNIFEAAKKLTNLRSIICITSDKCYKNDERIWPYREIDALGGDDPYSASKACSEIAAHSYWHSFFRDTAVNISTVRAGNVVGGGDFSKDRIFNDLITAFTDNKSIVLRNPNATRPWQHVIEPIYGYLGLVQGHLSETFGQFNSFNFGPDVSNVRSVYDLATEAIDAWGSGVNINFDDVETFHEAQILGLDSTKVKLKIGWQPKWNFEKTVKKTINWYKNRSIGKETYLLCLNDLKAYGE